MTNALTIQGRIRDNSTRRDLPATVDYGKFIAPLGDLPLYREHEGQQIGTVRFWRAENCLRFLGVLNYNIPDGAQLERAVLDGSLRQCSVSGVALEENISDTGLELPRFEVRSLSLVALGAIQDRSRIEFTTMEPMDARETRFRLLSRSDAAANERREIAELKERRRWKVLSGPRETKPMPTLAPAGAQWRGSGLPPWRDGTKQVRELVRSF